MDFDPSAHPSIFTHSFVSDPDNLAYLKFTQKRRKNFVDKDHCSRALLERALNNDQLYTAKIGIKYNKAYDHEDLEHTLTLRASHEVASNFTESAFTRSKVFLRYSKPINDNLYVQSSVTGGLIKNLSKEELKVNESFYLKNFKGIRNIGYHYDNSKKTNEGLLGENLGFDRYLSFSTKVYQSEAPLLKEFSIQPFAHFNLALAPNKDTVSNPKNYEGKSFLEKYGRFTAGFGASMQLGGVAVECYYNPVVIK